MECKYNLPLMILVLLTIMYMNQLKSQTTTTNNGTMYISHTLKLTTPQLPVLDMLKIHG